MITTREYKLRELLNLADFIEDKPDDTIDMRMWGHDCGTIRCAAGWWSSANPRSLMSNGEGYCPWYNNGMDVVFGFSALNCYFDFMGFTDIDDIFGKDSYPPYPSSREVADRIREVVGRYQ